MHLSEEREGGCVRGRVVGNGRPSDLDPREQRGCGVDRVGGRMDQRAPGGRNLLPKPVCGALAVRAVSVVESCRMGHVWVGRLEVGMMCDMDCACEEA
jgi:hypothetical protein